MLTICFFRRKYTCMYSFTPPLFCNFQLNFVKCHVFQYFPIRNIPQILLLLEHFLFKKVLIKHWSYFLKNVTGNCTFKVYFNYFNLLDPGWLSKDFSKDIIHGKTFRFWFRRVWKTFILHFFISHKYSNFMNHLIDWCWPDVD